MTLSRWAWILVGVVACVAYGARAAAKGRAARRSSAPGWLGRYRSEGRITGEFRPDAPPEQVGVGMLGGAERIGDGARGAREEA